MSSCSAPSCGCRNKSARSTACCSNTLPQPGKVGAPIHFYAELTSAQVVALADSTCIVPPSPASPLSPLSPASASSPPAQVRAAADIDTTSCGRVWLWFAANFDSVRYRVEVFQGKRITGAYLHAAPAGYEGAAVAVLFESLADPVDVNGHLVEKVLHNGDLIPCVDGPINIAELYTLVRDSAVYVDITSQAYPSGVLRGQIFSP